MRDIIFVSVGIALMSFTVKGVRLSKLLRKRNAPIVSARRLSLANCALNSIRGIERYPNIKEVTYLDLSDNNIQDLIPLEPLKALRTLILSANRVKDVRVLVRLPQLQTVIIDGNKIDQENLKRLCKIQNLQYLQVDANPVKTKSYQRKVKSNQGKNYLLSTEPDAIYYIDSPEKNDSCAVCLDTQDDKIVKTPCNHVFHAGCLNRVFHSVADDAAILCPNCRKQLPK